MPSARITICNGFWISHRATLGGGHAAVSVCWRRRGAGGGEERRGEERREEDGREGEVRLEDKRGMQVGRAGERRGTVLRPDDGKPTNKVGCGEERKRNRMAEEDNEDCSLLCKRSNGWLIIGVNNGRMPFK
eukprot:762517-Hanusia_phi.AAC.3